MTKVIKWKKYRSEYFPKALYTVGRYSKWTLQSLGEPKFWLALRDKGILEPQQCHIGPRTGRYGFTIAILATTLHLCVIYLQHRALATSCMIYIFSLHHRSDSVQVLDLS
jgi:hypothetical protein